MAELCALEQDAKIWALLQIWSMIWANINIFNQSNCKWKLGLKYLLPIEQYH